MFYYTNPREKIEHLSVLEKALAFAGDFLGAGDDLMVFLGFGNYGPVAGYADNTDDDEYEVLINRNLDLDEMIVTLFHEMVHVYQMYSGRYNVDEQTWDGVDYSKASYLERPWEIEAYELEQVMLKGFAYC